MTIYDVARSAGVSKSTVSRVINGDPGVAEDTAKSVRKAMSRLGYAPSINRPGPKPDQSKRRRLNLPANIQHGSVAVVNIHRSAELLDHPFYHRLFAVVRKHLGAAGLSLILDEMLPGRLPLAVQERRVDGVLLTGRTPTRELLDQLRGVPAVWLSSGHPRAVACDHVMSDNIAIGTLAFEHLASRGCRRLAYVSCEVVANSAADREQAFITAAQRAGLHVDRFVDTNTEPRPDDWLAAAVHQRIAVHVDAMLRDGLRHDGVFLPYDHHAAPFHRLMNERGIAVGGPGRGGSQLLTVSVGNEEQFLSQMTRRGATIDPGTADMGTWAVDLLLDRIAEPTRPPVRILVAPQLIEPI